MNLKSIGKKVTASFLAVALMLNLGIVSAMAQTEGEFVNGKNYKVPAQFLNAKKDGASALASYMSQEASFSYKDGKYIIDLTVVKAGVAVATYQTMESYSKYLENEDKEEFDKAKKDAKLVVEDKTNNTATYEVSADDLSDPLIITAKMDIPMPGGSVYSASHEVKVVFDTTKITEEALEDGTYSINGTMVKTTDKNSLSMTNDAIDHNIKLEVKDGKVTVYLDFKGLKMSNMLGYLGNLSYYNKGYTYNQYGSPEGKTTLATVISTQKDENGNDIIDQYNSADSLYPKLVSFPLETSEEYIPLQVFVPIMNVIAPGSGTQQVLLKLDWSTVKAAEDTDFGGNENEEQSPAVDQSDVTTGISISADKGVLLEGTKFAAKQITEGEIYQKAADSLSEIGKKFKLYDLNLFVNEQKVEPNGLVKVTLPIPAEYSKDKLKVYRIGENGAKTLITGNVENGNYVFSVNHFSYYALVEAESESVSDDAAKSDTVNTPAEVSGTDSDKSNFASPRTGDSNQAVVFALTGVMAILVIAGFIYNSIRRKNA